MTEMQTVTNPFPKSVSEDTFKDAVLRQALAFGWRRFHPLPAMSRRGKFATFQQGETGYPDLTLARKGVVLFRELKSNTGRLSPEQEAWGEELGEAWGVWRPTDWQSIVITLR